MAADTMRNGARINFRLPQVSKELIERAAAARGQSISDFATSTLVQFAQQVLDEQNRLSLSNRDRDAFLAALHSDQGPNQALSQAAERYWQGG